MSKRLAIPKPKTGRGWVGVWLDGSVGWWMPRHLSQGCNEPYACPTLTIGEDRLYLCEITVRPILTKMVRGRSRPITKIATERNRKP